MHCVEAIPQDSMICKKYKLEAGRHYNTPGSIPKWKRLHKSLIQNITACAYQNCSISSNNETLVHPSFESLGLICVSLGLYPNKYDSLCYV